MPPNNEPNYYELLGVPADADRATIKAAWSEKIQMYHPDTGGDTADPKKFMEVQKAFDTLGDEERRKLYDMKLAPAASAFTPPAANDDWATPGWGEYNPVESDNMRRKQESERRRKEWVPPHERTASPDAASAFSKPAESTSRTNSAHASSPPASSVPQQPAGTATEEPEDQEGPWQLMLKEQPKLQLRKTWGSLWGVPLGLVAASMLLFLVASAVYSAKNAALVLGGYALAFVIAGVVGLMNWGTYSNGKNVTPRLFQLAAVGLVIAAVAGFMAGVGVLFPAASVIAAVALFLFGEACTYKYVETRHMPAKVLKAGRYFNKPGAGAKDAATRINADFVATELRSLFAIESFRAYHGVWTPANDFDIRSDMSGKTLYGAVVKKDSYTDQVVTAGNKVAFINAVFFRSGQYTTNDWGSLLRNGENIGLDLGEHNDIYERWKAKLGDKYEVRVIVAALSDGPISCNIKGLGAEMISIHDLRDNLGQWMVRDQELADRKLNADIAQHLVDH